jgi:hypothetical protein
MTRSRLTARKAGSWFERCIADYLAEYVDDRIDRKVKTGNKDRGDVGGVRAFKGGRVVVECKDRGGIFEVGAWLTEAEIERGNDDAEIGLVVAKRRGRAHPGDQVVMMTLRDLVALLTGERPADELYVRGRAV